MIEKAEALWRAQDVVAAQSAAAGAEFVLLEDQTRDEPFGWVFFYQAAAFLESGDFRDQLVGNAPYLAPMRSEWNRTYRGGV